MKQDIMSMKTKTLTYLPSLRSPLWNTGQPATEPAQSLTSGSEFMPTEKIGHSNAESVKAGAHARTLRSDGISGNWPQTCGPIGTSASTSPAARCSHAAITCGAVGFDNSENTR